MRHLVYQPQGSNLCGQACIATVLGITLDEACDLVGKRGYTSTRHIREALAKRGFNLGDRMSSPRWRKKPRKGLYLARVKWVARKHTHWVLCMPDGRVFDPAFGYDPDWQGGHRTSFYLIEESPIVLIRELALEATRLMDTIDREELDWDKYQNLKDAAKRVHRIRQLAGG